MVKYLLLEISKKYTIGYIAFDALKLIFLMSLIFLFFRLLIIYFIFLNGKNRYFYSIKKVFYQNVIKF
jgi:hypothetical protein